MYLKLDVEKFNQLQYDLNLTDTAMANRLGINRSHLWKIKNKGNIGEKFIAGFKSAFPYLTIDDFFLAQTLHSSDTVKSKGGSNRNNNIISISQKKKNKGGNKDE